MHDYVVLCSAEIKNQTKLYFKKRLLDTVRKIILFIMRFSSLMLQIQRNCVIIVLLYMLLDVLNIYTARENDACPTR